MAIKYEIHYNNNPYKVYFPGQVVKGRAIIHLDEPTPIKGIRIRVSGYAAVRWDESTPTSSDNTTSGSHSEKETYFESFTDYNDVEGSLSILEVGTHVYNFKCHLPPQCPSSFEGFYGWIRYETQIIVLRPLLFNKSYSVRFNVLNIFDLNRLPHKMIPTSMEVIKNFCCGPCQSRPLVLSMLIQKQAFIPGEFINFNVKLINQSRTNVEKIRITLNLIAFYSVTRGVSTTTEKIAIAKKKFTVVEQNVMEIENRMQVPPTPPTIKEYCKIIKITFELEVTAKTKGMHKNPVLTIPITIGNIPFVARSANISEKSLIDNLKKGLFGQSGPMIDLNSKLSPPTYEEALFSHVSEDSSNEKFIPRYPFYNTYAFRFTSNSPIRTLT